MKICHLITRMILGGAQENTLLTLEQLKKQTPWELHLAYGPEFDEGNLVEETRKLGVHLHPLKHMKRNLNPFDDVLAGLELYQYFKDHKFDLVHTHSSKAGILGRIVARNAGVPIVIHTIHGLAFDEYQPFWKNFLYVTAEQIASDHCDRILTVCETMKRIALENHLGDTSFIQTVYSGFELEPFLQVPTRPPDGRFVIGVIARMFPFKGHEDLMKLAPALLSNWDDLDFHIVGDGPLRPLWDAWMKKHPQWGQRIRFAGRVSPGEVPAHLAKMDLMIHLSWREGLPRTVAQALAAARPVCAYDIGGTSEVVEQGVTGCLVPPGQMQVMLQSIETILNNRQAGITMGKTGREKVRARFSVETMGAEMIKHYQALS